MTGEDHTGGPLDVATLEVLARRAETHRLVDDWAFRPDHISPRRLELHLDDGQYPESVDASRLDVCWYEGGEYTFHYLESREDDTFESGEDDTWQCRWDHHSKPDAPTAHFHPPPDASADVEPSDLESAHHLGILFEVLDWIEARVVEHHQQ